MSQIAIKARELYRKGALSRAAVYAMWRAKKITEEERDWILAPEEAGDGDSEDS